MKVSIIVPVFNEEEAIPIFCFEINKVLTPYSFELIFINDGSNDNTASVLQLLQKTNHSIKIINFTRNFGKEPALFAGLSAATGDVVIPIDVDLQDPVDVIPRLISRFNEGFDVVLAKRVDRKSDGFFKRESANLFYKLNNKISSLQIEENVGDFRLLSKTVVDELKMLPERNLFMKGILSWYGGDISIVEYTREKRIAGETKFNGWKLWNLALDGITNFSTVPLRIWTYIGLVISTFSFSYGIWIIFGKLFFGTDVSGYSSTLVSILFLGGIQLIGIGVIGEYIGRIYLEVKARPRYLIKENKINED